MLQMTTLGPTVGVSRVQSESKHLSCCCAQLALKLVQQAQALLRFVRGGEAPATQCPAHQAGRQQGSDDGKELSCMRRQLLGSGGMLKPS